MVRFGFFIILFLLSAGWEIRAQDTTARPGALVDVTKGEYFWDTDPGEGMATALPNFSALNQTSVNASGTYDTDGLTPGFHTLYVRFQDEDGAWGVPVGRPVYIQSREQNPTISEGEVYVDTPVTPGLGQTISPVFASDEPTFQDVAYSLENFGDGFFNFIIQLENSDGVRGVPVSQRVYLRQYEDVGITDVEVFVNEDPGQGSATRIGGNNQTTVNITEGISTSGFQTGFNKLFVRMKNDQGVWGPTAQRMVYLPEAPEEAKTVAGIEVFFNQAAIPEPGEALALEPNDEAFDSDLEYGSVLAQTPFEPGEVGLYARTQNSDGDWGVPVRQTVDVIETRAIQGKLFTKDENGDREIVPFTRINIDYPGQQFDSYVTTDNRGFFSISNLEPNTYSLSYFEGSGKKGISVPDRAEYSAEVGSASDDVRYIEMDVQEPFKLLDITPQAFSSDIPLDPEFTLTFNKAIGTENGNLSDSILYVHSKSRGALGYTQSLSNGDSVVTINLRESLLAGEKITVGLRPVLSADGLISIPFETHYFSEVSGGGDVFTTSHEYAIPDLIKTLRLVDIDNDGDLDILTVTASDSLHIDLNSGDGAFVRDRSVKLLPDDSYSSIDHVAVDDINNDGYPDIVVYARGVNSGTAELRAMINNQDLTFTQSDKITFSGGLAPFLKIETLGISGDKYIVTSPDSIRAFRFSDAEQFEDPVRLMRSFGDIEVGDVTGDGIPDVVPYRISSSSVAMILGLGSGRSLDTFDLEESSALNNGRSVAAGFDYDDDGIMDLLQVTRSSSSFAYVLSEDNSAPTYLTPALSTTFTTYSSVNPVTTYDYDTAVGDILNNGELQMLSAANSYPDYDVVYTGKDDGGNLLAYQQVLEGTFDKRYYKLDAGDIDNDGDIDIVAGAQIWTGSRASGYQVELHQNRNGNIPPTLEFEFENQNLTTLSDPLTFNLPNLNYVTDPDGGGITFSATSSDESVVTASVDGSGVLTLTPQGAGSAAVTIQATDGQGESIFDTFTVDVQAINNDPPAIVAQIPDTTLESDEQAIFTFSEIFSDADFLTYSVEDLDSGNGVLLIALENDNQEFRITPQSLGSATVEVSASDAYATTSFTFEVTVTQATNDPPRIVYNQPDTVIVPGTQAALIPIETLFEDPDGDQLTYFVSYQDNGTGSAEFSPSGGEFGMLVISPASSTSYGQFSVSVTATDPSQTSATISFNVTFNDVPVERYTIDRAQVIVGSNIVYNLSTLFDDEYSPSALTYDIQYDGTSGFATQTGSNLSVQGTNEGTGIVAIRAYDGAFYSDTLSFPVEVVEESFSSISNDVTGSYYPNGVVVNKWGLLSIPGLNIQGTPQSIFDDLNGDFKLYSLTSDGQYEDVTEFTGNPFSPGTALWFRTNAQNDLYQVSTPAGSRVTNTTRTLGIPDGWSFISTPYDIPTNWNSQFRRSLVWEYDHNREQWVQLDDSDKLQPWTGYAVFSNDGDDLTLYINGTNFIDGLSAAHPNAKDDKISVKDQSASEMITIQADEFELSMSLKKGAQIGFDSGDSPVMPAKPNQMRRSPGFVIGEHLFSINTLPDKSEEDEAAEVIEAELFVPEEIQTFKWNSPETMGDKDDWMMVLVNEKYVRKIYFDELFTLGVSGDQVFKAFVGPEEIVEKFAVPQKHQLFDNYPNPFNPSTTIQFALANQADVRVEVYNLLGKRVRTLQSGQLSAGLHTTTFNATSLASGVYLYRLVVDGKVRSIKKMTLIK